MQTNPFIRKKRCSRAKEAYGNSDFKKPPDNGRLFDTMKKTEGRKKMDAHVISLANQKGGTAKTTTCANLGIGLAQAGRKVLLVDADAQGSLTLSLGWEPNELPITLYDLMIKAIQDRPVTHGEGMLHHEEGVDLLPANIELAGIRR